MMIKLRMPFGIGKHNDTYSTYISKKEYVELMNYAKRRGVKLEGFKRFSGNISVIKEIIDDIQIISGDFPHVLDLRKSVVVSNDDTSYDDDFATTIGHVIYINAHIFNNLDYLKDEYDIVAKRGHFVRGTTYRSIIRHELGHVVANMYGIDPMAIARIVLPGMSDLEIIKYVKDTLSLYAADYSDGREFISESFSAYYSGIDNEFAKEFVLQCMKLVKEECDNDEK